MWNKHRSKFQDHIKYIHNNIVNPFWVRIIQYTERVYEMHYLANYLPPLSMKFQKYDEAYLYVRYK